MPVEACAQHAAQLGFGVRCISLTEEWCGAQMGSFFVMQGANMDRNMFGGRFVIPSASLELFNTISIIALIPVYDRGVVPLLQRAGIKITHLQLIGGRLLAF